MTNKIRVLIVDDSAFARLSIEKRINADAEIEVVGHARDGVEAIARAKDLKPDVVTMDVTMPRMDGIEAVKRIMAECPVPIVMLSALTSEGADVTLEALDLGAIDFFLKHSLVSPVGKEDDIQELLAKIKNASRVNLSRFEADSSKSRRSSHVSRNESSYRRPRAGKSKRVIVIGSSTGGPRALNQVIPRLPGDLPAPILLVQHMPVGFTKSLAARLNNISELDVKEAQVGDKLLPGLVLIAPGGRHMTVDANGKIDLNEGPQECGLRPAVNVTMETAVNSYGSMVLGVVLTGMGSDGTRGSGLIRDAGGEVLVEDESTCVVYGMPKSIVEAGYASKVLPLPKIAFEMVKMCEVGQQSMAGV